MNLIAATQLIKLKLINRYGRGTNPLAGTLSRINGWLLKKRTTIFGHCNQIKMISYNWN